MATRTSLLGKVVPPAGPAVTLYTTPANYTAIWKSLWVFNAAAVADIIQVFISDQVVVAVWLYYNVSVPSFGRLEWNGWIVVPAASKIAVVSTQGNTQFWASGAILPG